MRHAEAGRSAQVDRSIGALVGLAVGDALGAPAEGKPRDSYRRLSEIEAGAGTDDTAMAICVAESLLDKGGVDGGDLMRRFLLWYRSDGTGISPTTRAVLEDFERSGSLDAADRAMNVGNGCLMRLAPVAIRYRGDWAAAREIAAAQARITHSAPDAVAATVLFAELLVAALDGGGTEALSTVAAGDYRSKARDRISSAPRAVDTLEAALWCVSRTESFEAAVIEAVNLGGDTDTIGAVTGQLAGALYGASAIPRRWTEAVRDAARLAELASRLHHAGSPV
jgi:ADP-ribosyl-[dinitrogen reductase] hydrolase